MRGPSWGATRRNVAFLVVLVVGVCALMALSGVELAGIPGATASTISAAESHLSASVLASTASALEAKAKAILASTAYAPILSGGVTPSAVKATASALLGSYGYLANEMPASLWSYIASLPTSQANRSVFQTANSNVDSFIIGLGIGDIFLIAVLCGATLGLGCAVVLGGIAIAAIVLYLLGAFCSWFGWGCASTPNYGKAADDLAIVMLGDVGYTADVLAQGMYNELQALNLSSNALDYEAAAVGIGQLGNSSFNVGLDLSSGGSNNSVAEQLATVLSADQTTLWGGIAARMLAEFSDEEGYGNSFPYYCPLIHYASGTDIPFSAADAAAEFTHCAASAPSTYYWAEGEIVGGIQQVLFPITSTAPTSACAEDWVLEGSQISYFAALKAFPVNGGAEISLAVPTDGPSGTTTDAGFFVNWTHPTGGYWFCAAPGTSSGGSSFALDDGFPLNASSASTAGSGSVARMTLPMGATWDQYGGPHTEYSVTSGTVTDNVINVDGSFWEVGPGTSSYVSSPYGFGISLYGGNTNASSYNATSLNTHGYSTQVNLVKYLYALASIAGTEAQAYVGFLWSQGYTSASQIPPRCLIPTPSQLFPSNIPPSALETMNESTFLEWYIATLTALGQDFLTNLTTLTFCNHPLHSQGIGMGFGTFAFGYVYVPYYTKSSDGLVAQKYTTPSTWNWSGLIYIAPSAGNYTIPLNERWLLSDNFPSELFVQPFTKTPASGSYPIVNRTGPSYCANQVHLSANATSYNFGSVSGCNSTAGFAIVSGLVAGNSSLSGGSQYPTGTAAVAEANISVYLTACFTAKGGSSVYNPAYYFNTSGVCAFSDTKLNNTGLTCDGTVAYYDGQIIGTCPSPPPVLVLENTGCGLGIPILGTIVDYVANAIAGVPVLGVLACGIGWLVGILFVVAIIALVAWVVVEIVRVARGD